MRYNEEKILLNGIVKGWMIKVRKKYTAIEKELMEKMADNLKAIMDKKDVNQRELADMTGFSTSAINDYVNAKTLMSPSNLSAVAEALGVANGDIDPTFRGSAEIKNSSPRYITGDELDSIAIEDLAKHNLTRKGRPLTEEQKNQLVKILQSAADLLDQ